MAESSADEGEKVQFVSSEPAWRQRGFRDETALRDALINYRSADGSRLMPGDIIRVLRGKDEAPSDLVAVPEPTQQAEAGGVKKANTHARSQQKTIPPISSPTKTTKANHRSQYIGLPSVLKRGTYREVDHPVVINQDGKASRRESKNSAVLNIVPFQRKGTK